MTSYTINLPKTSFPMKAGLPHREPKILEYWRSIDLYQYFTKPHNARGTFILHDGPPYANGELHLGHALNKILKDIVNKNKMLEGYGVPYVPGWDCHGLPIEINVEKKIGKVGANGVTRERFITECRKYAISQIELQMKSFQRMGVIGDWQNYYSTMDFRNEAGIVRSLMEMVQANYIVHGYKPVHWCIACGSALAEAEVEYRDKVSPAIDIRFRVLEQAEFKADKLSFPVWTTTPWTLSANEAVTVHPRMQYVLVHCLTLKEHFFVLEELLAQVMERYGETNYKVIHKYSGKDLEGLVLQHPFLQEKKVPVILGEHVTTDIGTGAVHTAPAHGLDDYKIGIKYNLPVVNPVGSDGKFISTTQYFAGLEVFAANAEVIKILEKQENLIYATTIQHSYPQCWRHKTPLIFRATKQWFINMGNVIQNRQVSLRTLALEEVHKVNWVPPQGEGTITKMVMLRPDWCISRQRTWGVPLALVVHKQSGDIHPEMSRLLQDVIVPGIAQEGVIYWHNLDIKELLHKHTSGEDIEEYEKVTDILDVWFDSGVTHYSVLGKYQDLHVPADLYLEGVDQYRGWFQSSLLTACMLYGHAPYKTVLTHGFTVDAKGHKMSKSLGNIITPAEIIEKYGADILRLWTASTYLHDDIAISEDILARQVDTYRMVRNTARFLLGNLYDFNVQYDLIKPNKLLSLDRFIVKSMLQLATRGQEHYNLYQFHTLCGEMQRLLTNEISSFYFSVIKDRLYTMASTSFGRRSAQSSLFYMLEILVRLIAPVLSFTAEEIWQEICELEQKYNITGRVKSVFMARWDDLISEDSLESAEDLLSDEDWITVQNVRNEVNKELEKLRVAGVIGSSLAAEVKLYGNTQVMKILNKLGDDLRFVLLTSTAELQDFALASLQSVPTLLEGLSLAVDASPHKKCIRCWHYRADVGLDAKHPELCGRCLDNLFGSGEQRACA